MENAPLNPDADDAEAQATGKKTRKSTKRLVGFMVEPKNDKDKQSTKDAKDIWQALSLTKRRAGRSEASVSLSHVPSTEALPPGEVSEAEAPLEALSQPERQFVAREIIASRQASEPEQAADPDHQSGNQEALTAAEAVALFRDKVVAEGHDLEQAFTEVLASLDVENTTEPALSAIEASETNDQSAASSVI